MCSTEEVVLATKYFKSKYYYSLCSRLFSTIQYHTKSQFISKENFGVSNSSKNEPENLNFCPSLLGQKFFVRFLEELKKPKSPFKIN